MEHSTGSAETIQLSSINSESSICDTSLPVVYLSADISWENDFIRYELFPKSHFYNITNDEVTWYFDHGVDSFQEYWDKHGISPETCVVVFSTNRIDSIKINWLIEKMKPLVTIMLSDEWGQDKNYNIISLHTKLLIRNYHHAHHNLSQYTNVLCAPLGYTNNMLYGAFHTLPFPKRSMDRKYAWSFIGNVGWLCGNDREIMRDQFTASELGEYVFRSGVDKEEMCEIYKESVFVPVGKGNHTHNCFRIYEAIVAGALPVIAGPREELDVCFFYEKNHPFILVETWDDAVVECRRLLENPDELHEKQVGAWDWWRGRIAELKSVIDDVFE